jgi:nucleotide-binding universal stress UspA family protein
MLQRLLAMTDFSDQADNAVARAARIATECQAALHLLHVVSEPSLAALRDFSGVAATDLERSLLAATESTLDRSAEAIAHDTGVTVTSSVRIGRVLEEIVAAAQQADLIVMGARGTNPIRDAVLGTTAERLLSRSSAPTLVVRRPAIGRYDRVVAAFDGSPGSPKLIAAAATLCPAAEVHVVNAFDLPFEGRLRVVGVAEAEIQRYRRQQGERAMASIQRAIAHLPAAASPRFVPVVAHGNAIEVLLEHERATRADLIVIGKHCPQGLADFLLGSVTRHVLADASCDVLVVALSEAAAER